MRHVEEEDEDEEGSAKVCDFASAKQTLAEQDCLSLIIICKRIQ